MKILIYKRKPNNDFDWNIYFKLSRGTPTNRDPELLKEGNFMLTALSGKHLEWKNIKSDGKVLNQLGSNS